MPKALLLQAVLISLHVKELSNRVILVVCSFHNPILFYKFADTLSLGLLC